MNSLTKWLNDLASRLMPVTTKKRMDWTLSLLDIKPNDKVLEIGFGPGNCLYHVSQKLENGQLIGIDSLDTNFLQAEKFNAYEIEQGKMELKKGTVEIIKEYENYFDKIYTINSIQLWENTFDGLKIAYHALKAGGVMAITFQSFDNGTRDEDVISFGEMILAECKKAGFQDPTMETLKMKPVPAVCILAKK